MSNSFKLLAATPEKVIFNGEVVSLSIPGEQGYMVLLPDHAHLISLIKEGEVVISPVNHPPVKFQAAPGIFEIYQNEASLLVGFAR